MNFVEESLLNMIFSKNTPWNFFEVMISMNALSVLIEINGKTTLGSIGKKLNLSVHDLQNTVNDLGRLNLIKIAEKTPVRSSLTQDEQAMPKQNSFIPIPEKLSSEKRLYRGVRF